MSRSRTPQALRRLAADLTERYPGCRAQAEPASGGSWELRWTDGPSIPLVRTQAAAAAPDTDVELLRTHSPRAWALAAIRACLAGQIRPGTDGPALVWRLEEPLAATEDPDQAPEGERLGKMAEELLAQAQDTLLPHLFLAPVATDGAAHLLTPFQAKPGAESGPLVMSPAEHLTARYARGQDVREWRFRLRTLPVADLVAAAQADKDLDRAGRLAVLGLLDDMRQLWESTEAGAFASARDTGAPGGAASWAQIGAVLGISRQAAHERGTRRAQGTPARLSS
ncbi:hypothetical protein ACFWTE_11690 [Nocardiopsis sp. NPDC058631]|uniref:hypothetical protein n=1 Tax=Nocardiopsis sp. NPDC058631 TaxID=3346566 RepID=UPI003652A25F